MIAPMGLDLHLEWQGTGETLLLVHSLRISDPIFVLLQKLWQEIAHAAGDLVGRTKEEGVKQ